MKSVVFLRFTFSWTKVFTLRSWKPLEFMHMSEGNDGKRQNSKYKNAREREREGRDPYKRVAPALLHTTRQLRCRVHRQ